MKKQPQTLPELLAYHKIPDENANPLLAVHFHLQNQEGTVQMLTHRLTQLLTLHDETRTPTETERFLALELSHRTIAELRNRNNK